MLTLPGHVVVSDRGPWRGYGGSIAMYDEPARAEAVAQAFTPAAQAAGAGKLRAVKAELRIELPQSSQSSQRKESTDG